MQRAHGRFRPNDRDVAAKVLDDEVVLINLKTGVYYGMQGTAAQVWSLLSAGHPVEEIGAALSVAFGIDDGQVDRDLAEFVEKLLSEELVLAAGDEGTNASAAAATRRTASYEAPVVEVYRDMADIFALDPPLPEMPDIAHSRSDRDAKE